jgi:cysteinyl-tRNA synthetase
MNNPLQVYNSLTRQKETFAPRQEGYVGMYVCGPTVYSDVHLGNCRTFVSFDIIYRHLLYLGYKVRYVRNITDVGHLTGDTDDGEDKISKRALLEKIEPMEVVQKYMNGFHDMMNLFNTKAPSIEPRATGHIIEQIEMVQSIIDNGYGYVQNGSVYFDTLKFSEDKKSYGALSGRVIEELMSETRDNLKNQSEKRHPADFAIWMKAAPEHLMKWNSPWSEGFPGWHLECSAMSTKYLGSQFDIHGGGNDLKFPHHENEIAQNEGACGCAPAKYWLHTNMLLMNGRKMAKSEDNSITPEQLFTGDSTHVSKGYSPMVLRFFMLMAHYRSTLDITDEALLAAEKGYKKMMESYQALEGLHTNNTTQGSLDADINRLIQEAHDDMNDDFNTPKALSRLFELVSKVNGLKGGQLSLEDVSMDTLNKLKKAFKDFIFDIFGLKNEMHQDDGHNHLDGAMQLIIQLRADARETKNWAVADKIRDTLNELEITLKDGKNGTEWSIHS